MLIDAKPYAIDLAPAACALLIIDMQRDFLEPGGFGDMLGNDVGTLRHAIAPTVRLLASWRRAGLTVIHTREGHRPDLSDLPPSKRIRGRGRLTIGDTGPLGRILIRGEFGQDIIDDLKPVAGEPIIDKPGKGAFYATDLHDVLAARQITHLIVAGVTTEVCVHTTIREGNDRGFECVAVADCCASYFPDFHRVALDMIVAQNGIFGWVTSSAVLLDALASGRPSQAVAHELTRRESTD